MGSRISYHAKSIAWRIHKAPKIKAPGSLRPMFHVKQGAIPVRNATIEQYQWLSGLIGRGSGGFQSFETLGDLGAWRISRKFFGFWAARTLKLEVFLASAPIFRTFLGTVNSGRLRGASKSIRSRVQRPRRASKSIRCGSVKPQSQ